MVTKTTVRPTHGKKSKEGTGPCIQVERKNGATKLLKASLRWLLLRPSVWNFCIVTVPEYAEKAWSYMREFFSHADF
ncbi:hypothetical protein DBR37_03240 [Herminiimonas sp. KBW02]|uniref:hypothetical protein n=1 Tax=Herminiimonas sp. KBW02 TaxID=2153363 RepID=UPI000F5B5906|nr:hypothetical protein [Herminiimonas sp. KBW02]RQO37217.1 hypothetical protein DBR37_03240 [Herminiimonas sp. KBW02]